MFVVGIYNENGRLPRMRDEGWQESSMWRAVALRGRDSVILNNSPFLLPPGHHPISVTHPTLPSSCHRASLGSFRDPSNPLMRGSRGCRWGGQKGPEGEGTRGGSTPRSTRASQSRGLLAAAVAVVENCYATSARYTYGYTYMYMYMDVHKHITQCPVDQ